MILKNIKIKDNFIINLTAKTQARKVDNSKVMTEIKSVVIDAMMRLDFKAVKI